MQNKNQMNSFIQIVLNKFNMNILFCQQREFLNNFYVKCKIINLQNLYKINQIKNII